MQTSIHEIFKIGGVLAQGNTNYKERRGQIDAAIRLDAALNKDNSVFILEGPCGFGKSLTYLIPTVKNFIENDFAGKVVIATSNISLQEQLIEKDIPFVLERLESLNHSKISVKERIKPTELKGIGNFICLEKLNDSDIISKFTALDTEQELRGEYEKLVNYIKEQKQGDITKFKINISPELRNAFICSSSDDCSSTSCIYEEECFYNKQKADAKSSKMIVTNYHMLFSSVLNGSSVFEKTTRLICDEVHEAESILREFTAQSITRGTFKYIREQRDLLEKKCISLNYEDGMHIMKETEISSLEEHAEQYFKEVKRMHKEKLELKPYIITSQNELPNAEEITVILNKLKTNLLKLLCLCQNEEKESGERKLIAIIERLQKTCSKALLLLNEIDKLNKDINVVTWVEKTTNNKNEKNIIIGKKEIDVSDTFSGNFLKEDNTSVVLTSATISSGGNFEYLKDALGVTKSGKMIVEYLGKTPFKLEKQELWFAPGGMVNAKHEKHFEISAEIMVDLIKATNGGVLLLFTSNENLNRSKEVLRKEFGNQYTILAQGEMAKSMLIQKFKEDENSILLGSKSFFTGVDVQSKALRCVIIDKLPFNNISDPVAQRLNKEKGAFFKYFLPEMTILLRQAVGRGVRTTSDHCVICILDSRLYEAKYRSLIFQSFGYRATATRYLDRVKNFIENVNWN